MARSLRAAAAVVVLLLAASALPGAEPQDARDSKDLNRLASFEDLHYPLIAQRARIQGLVVMRVGYDANGRVTSASGLSGQQLLMDVALANVRKWTFKPNSGTSAIIVYDFHMDDGACHTDSDSVFLLRHWNFATIVVCSPVIVG